MPRKETGKSECTMAELLGFSGSRAFAFWFRKQFGRTVSQWRRANAPVT